MYCDVKVRKVDLVFSDVFVGFLVVYVGDEWCWFVIRVYILKYVVFCVFLEKLVEEFGYKYDGGLIIVCDVVFFEYLLWFIEIKSFFFCRMELWYYWVFVFDNIICYMVD